MSRLAYVDGRVSRLADAAIHVEDRGLQFADSIYEVVAVMNGQLFDWTPHLARLERNLKALFIPLPMSPSALGLQAKRLVRDARLAEGLLYIQVTRGQAKRDHGFPDSARPSLIMTTRPFDFAQRIGQQAKGIAAITVNDQRWARTDIKSTGLLPNVLAKQDARNAGAFEALFVAEDGTMREGGSTNVWMVRNGLVLTHPLSAHILPGICRATALRLAEAAQIRVDQRAFNLDELFAADEAFLTSTTAPLLSIVRVDGRTIGTGAPGPVTRRLAELMWDEIARQTGYDPRRLA